MTTVMESRINPSQDQVKIQRNNEIALRPQYLDVLTSVVKRLLCVVDDRDQD